VGGDCAARDGHRRCRAARARGSPARRDARRSRPRPLGRRRDGVPALRRGGQRGEPLPRAAASRAPRSAPGGGHRPPAGVALSRASPSAPSLEQASLPPAARRILCTRFACTRWAR
jgi:hypothetical protein